MYAKLWNTTPSTCATVRSVTAGRKCKTNFFDFPLSHTLTPMTTNTTRKERYRLSLKYTLSHNLNSFFKGGQPYNFKSNLNGQNGSCPIIIMKVNL